MTNVVLKEEVPQKRTVYFFTKEEAAKKGMGKLFEGKYLESRVLCSGQEKIFAFMWEWERTP